MNIGNTKDNKFIKNFAETLQNMTVKDQLKIPDHKIRQGQADYDMYIKNAKIAALSSGKYEYLTGEVVGYRPDPIQKAKFEYSPLGQVFNKGLTTGKRSEGLL